MASQEIFQLALIVVFAGVAFAAALVRVSIRVAERLGLVDVPGSLRHKRHERATPLAGGLLFIASLLALLLMFSHQLGERFANLIAVTTIVFIFGLLDDLRGFGAAQKIFGQLLATFALIGSGINVAILSGFPPYSTAANLLITVIWMIGITNAFNLVDGADGLAVCVSLVATLFLLVGATVDFQPELILWTSGLLGILVVVLFCNLRPARLFLGDSGAQSLGFLIAALCIVYTPHARPQASTWFAPITFVALPIFDVCLVFFSRLRRGKPFYKADLSHTYHRLRMAGYSHSRALVLFCLTGMLVGAIGLFSLYQEPLVSNLIFAGLLIAGVVLFFHLERVLDNREKIP